MQNLQSIVNFIRTTYRESKAFIPLHDPRFIGNEKRYLLECIDSNFVSSVGEFVGRFEQMTAEYTGAKYAVATVNGTAALHIALQLSGVEQGDEVITQSLTFIATANAISYTGAHPVFLDVDRETMGLSPAAVEAWLVKNVEIREIPSDGKKENTVSTLSPFGGIKGGQGAFNKHTNRRIAACVPMHTFGHPVKLDVLQKILKKYNIPLIEDAAESLGSYYKEKHTGTFGKFGILSFNGNKVITTGGGGMILTDNKRLAELAKHITTQAKIPHRWEYKHDFSGYNYRLTNIAAALGCAQLEQLDYLLHLKRKLAENYKNFFADSEFDFFTEPKNCRSNYWLNVLLAQNRTQRDNLLEYTNKNGVMTRPVWEPINRMPMFAHCQTDKLKNTLWLTDRVVNIPSGAPIPGYGKK